jgi:hypothetical protein
LVGPSLRAVFNEDAVSIAGDMFALAGLALSQTIGSSTPHAVAAALIALVLIALVLIRISLRLAKRNHDFLLGQPIPASDRDRMRDFLLTYDGVTAVRELLVTYIGPDQVWVLARINIADELRSNQVTSLVRGIESEMDASPHISTGSTSCLSDRNKAGSSSAPATSGSGSHGPKYSSRLTRAERSSSIASLAVTVVRYPRTERTIVPACTDCSRRRKASCTMSSASPTVPSIS